MDFIKFSYSNKIILLIIIVLNILKNRQCCNQQFTRPTRQVQYQKTLKSIKNGYLKMKNWTAKLLLLANIPPLAGVMFQGWDIKQGIILYWLETIVIGLFSIVKGFIAKAPDDVIEWLSKYGKIILLAYKLIITLLVSVAVGVYALVTGIIAGFMTLITDYGVHDLPDGITPPEYMYNQVAAQNIRTALIIICLSHAISFVVNFLIKKEYKTNQMNRQMEILSRRVGAVLLPVVPCMFLFAIIASLENILPGNTMALHRKVPAVLLILSKTYFDYKSHLKEHGPHPASSP